MEKYTKRYIQGLIQCVGRFTFYTGQRIINGKKRKVLIPAFVVSLKKDDIAIAEAIKEYLKLSERIIVSKNIQADRVKRSQRATLVLRSYASVNQLIRFVEDGLVGKQERDYKNWLHRIKTDPKVADRYKNLAR